MRILRHDSVDSTNERAFAALAEGSAQGGDIHVATEQTAGRGRFGRRWESAAGEGLYLSLVHLPSPPSPHPAALTMAAGLAVARAVERLGVDPRLDWPNDVVVGRNKLAGILVEARSGEREPLAFVVGVGLNVLQREFPRELTDERGVTSLALEGSTATPEDALAALAEELTGKLALAGTAPEEIARDYLERTRLAGRSVRVLHGNEERTGRVVALTLAEGLRLELPGGVRHDLPLEHVRSLEAASEDDPLSL